MDRPEHGPTTGLPAMADVDAAVAALSAVKLNIPPIGKIDRVIIVTEASMLGDATLLQFRAFDFATLRFGPVRELGAEARQDAERFGGDAMVVRRVGDFCHHTNRGPVIWDPRFPRCTKPLRWPTTDGEETLS